MKSHLLLTVVMSGCPGKETWPAASNMGGAWERQTKSARKIWESLLKTHGASLSNESLQTRLVDVKAIMNSRPLTLLVDVKAIMNSRPLTSDLLSDINSLTPLSPKNLLTMKSKVVIPPPEVFSTPNIYPR